MKVERRKKGEEVKGWGDEGVEKGKKGDELKADGGQIIEET